MKVAFVPYIKRFKKKHIKGLAKIILWFSTGAFLAIFFLAGFSFLIFRGMYKNVVYPGVYVNEINFEGKTENQVQKYFANRNFIAKESKFIFKYEKEIVATVSAKDIDYGYNENLLAFQAFSIGRSGNSLSNLVLVIRGYINGVRLPPSYRFSEEKLYKILSVFLENTEKKPIDALFNFENGKVTAFKPSSDGLEVNKTILAKDLTDNSRFLLSSKTPETVTISIKTTVLKPTTSTENANNFGIKELIGTGTSHFAHSIPGRIYNINLATSKFNGVLVPPNEIFSFDKVLGDVSAFTGYQQAYIIKEGKTVLGDGGGVCQVSTTLFRAILNAGLPVVERHAHAYRVGYYEQDSGPGFDATTYVPSVDLKFKNDTGNYILIQTAIDPDNLQLTFYLYGTSDGRTVNLSKPVITSQTPAPPDVYQDDPTLPKGQIKQIDFAAAGANVYFTREVTKNGKIIISDKFVSNYQPWQAIYLKGTKE